VSILDNYNTVVRRSVLIIILIVIVVNNRNSLVLLGGLYLPVLLSAGWLLRRGTGVLGIVVVTRLLSVVVRPFIFIFEVVFILFLVFILVSGFGFSVLGLLLRC
jgi:hypothetical protein